MEKESNVCGGRSSARGWSWGVKGVQKKSTFDLRSGLLREMREKARKTGRQSPLQSFQKEQYGQRRGEGNEKSQSSNEPSRLLKGGRDAEL